MSTTSLLVLMSAFAVGCQETETLATPVAMIQTPDDTNTTNPAHKGDSADRVIAGTVYRARIDNAGRVDDLKRRMAHDRHLAAYNASGGLAYWQNSKRGQDPNGRELMVRRCNTPDMRVPTLPG